MIFARYVYTGERHLGDETGMEKARTFSRTKEITVNKWNPYAPARQVVVGGFVKGFLAIRDHDDFGQDYGISGLRKF